MPYIDQAGPVRLACSASAFHSSFPGACPGSDIPPRSYMASEDASLGVKGRGLAGYALPVGVAGGWDVKALPEDDAQAVLATQG